MNIRIERLDKIHEAAREFLKAVGTATVFAFDGKMGAGKTTFIKAICEEMGVKDVITSPTFALVNEYTDGQGRPVYHFDFYRIKRVEEAYDIGCEDFFLTTHCTLRFRRNPTGRAPCRGNFPYKFQSSCSLIKKALQ